MRLLFEKDGERERERERDGVLESKTFTKLVVCMTTLLVVLIEKALWLEL
jgi:hypothetical protein